MSDWQSIKQSWQIKKTDKPAGKELNCMMRKISEEQRAILHCYHSDDKQTVMEEIKKGIPPVEDAKIREQMEILLELFPKLSDILNISINA